MNCFISLSTEVGNAFGDKIRKILLRNNITPIDIYDFSIGGNLTNLLEDKIKKTDMFLAIITNLSPYVFYEIGIAKGLNKPILIVLSKNIDTYPSFLNEFLYVKANSNDDENIDFALKQFVKNQLKQKKREKINQHTDETSTNLPVNWKRELLQLRKNGTGKELENYMVNIINSLSATSKIVEEDKGVDFALWLDDADPILGNPILIEVKYGNINNETLINAELQLQNYIIKTKSKAGLLLYLDKSGNRFSLGTSLNPFIIRMDLEDFLSEIQNKKQLVNIILNYRNFMAHGKGIE